MTVTITNGSLGFYFLILISVLIRLAILYLTVTEGKLFYDSIRDSDIIESIKHGVFFIIATILLFN